MKMLFNGTWPLVANLTDIYQDRMQQFYQKSLSVCIKIPFLKIVREKPMAVVHVWVGKNLYFPAPSAPPILNPQHQ